MAVVLFTDVAVIILLTEFLYLTRFAYQYGREPSEILPYVINKAVAYTENFSRLYCV